MVNQQRIVFRNIAFSTDAQEDIFMAAADTYERFAKGIMDKCYMYSKYDVIRLLLKRGKKNFPAHPLFIEVKSYRLNST